LFRWLRKPRKDGKGDKCLTRSRIEEIGRLVRESRTRRKKDSIARASVEGMVKRIRETSQRVKRKNKATSSRASVEGMVKRIRETSQRVKRRHKERCSRASFEGMAKRIREASQRVKDEET